MTDCRIQLIDGSDLILQIDNKCFGQELFDSVCQKIGLTEVDYFGLTYPDIINTKLWMNNSKRVDKQIKDGPWYFSFEIKFYPPSPKYLSEEISRYQLFLQLRNDIITGRLPCSFVTYALLGSYAVQSQLGDYIITDHGVGHYYLKDIQFATEQNFELLEKISEFHKNHRGMRPEEAELLYLENASRLSLYGVHMYQVQDFENCETQIGICSTGIVIYRGAIRLNRFTWPKILKISYKRNVFSIKIRRGEREDAETNMDFRLNNYKAAKRLWRLALEHHSFFRLRETESMPYGLFARFGPKYRFMGKTFHQAALQKVEGGDYINEESFPRFKRVAGNKYSGPRTVEKVLFGTRDESFFKEDIKTPIIEADGSIMDHSDIINSYSSKIKERVDNKNYLNSNDGYTNSYSIPNRDYQFYNDENEWKEYTFGSTHQLISDSSDCQTNQYPESILEKTDRFVNNAFNHSQGYDRALTEAISAVTNMNTNYIVEKIEIQSSSSDAAFF